LLDEIDADETDLAIGYAPLLHGQIHHKQRKLFTENWLCMFNAEMTGLAPPVSLDDYLRLPHVVTSLRPGRSARGIVDGALDKLGLRRSIALTTPRFLTVPSLVERAPVIVTMQARLARASRPNSGSALARFRWTWATSRYRCCGIRPTIRILLTPGYASW
jgi:LysR family transcriptional activator of mexEF-oprN operon